VPWVGSWLVHMCSPGLEQPRTRHLGQSVRFRSGSSQESSGKDGKRFHHEVIAHEDPAIRGRLRVADRCVFLAVV
jgi:hypothetical protein